jgi:hypothetical protein
MGTTHSIPVRVNTGYITVDDFIHGFCRALDERCLQLGLTKKHPIGSVLKFSVHLANGRAVFSGSGRIVEQVNSRNKRAVMGVRIEIDELQDESRTMRRCLLMARQALVLANAADQISFGPELPDYAKSSLPHVLATPPPRPRVLPSGTAPPALTAPALTSIGDEQIETMASTKVIVSQVKSPTPPLPSVIVADSLKVGQQTERVCVSALAPAAPRRPAWAPALLILVAAITLALLVGAALHFA